MKLAMVSLAALLFAGCLDENTTNDGYLAGLRPAKPSADDPTDGKDPYPVVSGLRLPKGIDLADIDTANIIAVDQIKSPEPLGPICGHDCQIIAVTVKDPGSAIQDVHMFTDGGIRLCHIQFGDNGVIEDDCGWTRI